jgi:hypothetical protein
MGWLDAVDATSNAACKALRSEAASHPALKPKPATSFMRANH